MNPHVAFVIGVILIMIAWKIFQREKPSLPKTWHEDRMPRRDEFFSDCVDLRHGRWGKSADDKYWQAFYEWRQHMMKRITYTMPLEEALVNEHLELYLQETSGRNEKYNRNEGDRQNDTYRACCQVCGSGRCSGRLLRYTLCDDCYAMMESDSRADSDYKLPPGAKGFSAELWTLQMAIALDLETGVIDEAQAKREQRIIVELERRRLEKEERLQQSRRKNEAEKQQAIEQRATRIANAAKRLR